MLIFISSRNLLRIERRRRFYYLEIFESLYQVQHHLVVSIVVISLVKAGYFLN